VRRRGPSLQMVQGGGGGRGRQTGWTATFQKPARRAECAETVERPAAAGAGQPSQPGKHAAAAAVRWLTPWLRGRVGRGLGGGRRLARGGAWSVCDKGRLGDLGPARGELLRPRLSLRAAQAALRGASARPEPADGPGRRSGAGSSGRAEATFQPAAVRAMPSPCCASSPADETWGGGTWKKLRLWSGRRRAAEAHGKPPSGSGGAPGYAGAARACRPSREAEGGGGATQGGGHFQPAARPPLDYSTAAAAG
jgi:hypothetical protein